MRGHQLNIRISPEEKAAWNQLSERFDMPLSDIVRRVLNGIAAGKIKNIPIVKRPGAPSEIANERQLVD